jgi:hypothetical protein
VVQTNGLPFGTINYEYLIKSSKGISPAFLKGLFMALVKKLSFHCSGAYMLFDGAYFGLAL